MWKMILVDDEKILRETIAQVIDWRALNIDLIGVCKNGLEAFDLIVDESPDIVMTDICMPGFSGLELIEKVRMEQMEIEFVILSGYGEFEYAKKAMEYAVRYYLLKPCGEDQIVQTMHQVVALCEKRLRSKERENALFHRECVLRTMRELGTALAEDAGRVDLTLAALHQQVACTQDASVARAVCMQLLLSFWQAADSIPKQARMNLLFQLNAAQQVSQILELTAQGLRIPRQANSVSGRYKDYIHKCIAYTDDHYGDASLTLKWICENILFMNVDYVSKQFLMQTGQRFSAYLGRLRIEKAQQLLARGEKLNWVAQQVGCGNNPQYFSQMFKKHTGVSPKIWQSQNDV